LAEGITEFASIEGLVKLDHVEGGVMLTVAEDRPKPVQTIGWAQLAFAVGLAKSALTNVELSWPCRRSSWVWLARRSSRVDRDWRLRQCLGWRSSRVNGGRILSPINLGRRSSQVSPNRSRDDLSRIKGQANFTRVQGWNWVCLNI